MSNETRTLRVAVATALTIGTGIGLLLWGPAGVTAASVAPPALIEAQHCTVDPPAAGPTATAPAPARRGDTTIRLTVPPTAVVRLSADGQVETAWTNTGCAPSASDEIYVERADGRLEPLGALPSVDWVGDFRAPGVSQAQR